MSALSVSTPTGQVTLRDDRAYVVGRGRDSDVVVADSRVSRNHIRLEPGAGEWVARDTSANGMWCDGRKVSTVTVGGGSVRLRLGAADGPEVVMAVERPAGPPPPDPDLDEAATMLAPGSSGRGVPPPTVPRPAPPPAGPVGAPRTAAPAAPAPTSEAAAPSTATHWLQVIPTLLWLAAIGFALGALVALS